MRQTRLHRRTILLRGPVGALALALTTACANGQPPSEAPASLARMQALIGSAPCESDAQCRTVPVGAKACGGPEAWLAWSVAATDGVALQAEAERLARVERSLSAAKGMASNCAFVADPGAWCAPAGAAASATGATAPVRSCRLRSAGRGGAADLR